MVWRNRVSSSLTFLFIILSVSFAQADLKRFEQVAPGIYRGDQPDTLADYEELKALGIKTIINLREERKLVAKESFIVSELEMTMMSFPMNAFAYPRKAKVDIIMQALMNPENHPVYLHCQHGKDRTGLLIGLYRVNIQGAGQREVWNEMLERGFSRVLIGLSRYFFNHTDPAGSMIARVDDDEVSNRE